jgi:hypothetical protein
MFSTLAASLAATTGLKKRIPVGTPNSSAEELQPNWQAAQFPAKVVEGEALEFTQSER